MAYTSIYELKRHLNIESTYIDDDGYLQDLVEVAAVAIQNYLNDSLSGFTETNIPMPIKQAALLLSAHLYSNRQIVAFANGVEIPYTYKFLLDPYKNYIIV